jgi:hypothetical protein
MVNYRMHAPFGQSGLNIGGLKNSDPRGWAGHPLIEALLFWVNFRRVWFAMDGFRQSIMSKAKRINRLGVSLFFSMDGLLPSNGTATYRPVPSRLAPLAPLVRYSAI